MYRSMLFLHWKQIRPVLALLVVGCFALPLLAVGGLGTPQGMDGTTLEAYRFVGEFQSWLPVFPLTALAVGVILALSAWNWDHQLGHVYALSLPMTRWDYTLQKMLAGVTLAAVPAVALWVGAHLATASIVLPAGLHAYPNELAVRFFAATLLSYALLFALAAGTMRTALAVVAVVFGFIFLGSVANDLLGRHVDFFARVHVVKWVFETMLEAPGPLEVFSGSWSLIDV